MRIASCIDGTRACVYIDGVAEGLTRDRLEEAVIEALAPRDAAPAAGPWVSVEDALPEEDMVVLLRREGADAVLWTVGYLHRDDWYDTCGYAIYPDDPQAVTHWAEVRV